MWMEERLGTRINENRTEEALEVLAVSGGTEKGAIAVGCPFCQVMLTDGLTAKQATGDAAQTVEVLDVAQLLLESVRRSGPAS
jgi:Fe-S oxidoreductase